MTNQQRYFANNHRKINNLNQHTTRLPRTYLSHRGIEKAFQDIEQLAPPSGRSAWVFRLCVNEVTDLTALKCVLALSVSRATRSVVLCYLGAQMFNETAAMEMVAKSALDRLRG